MKFGVYICLLFIGCSVKGQDPGVSQISTPTSTLTSTPTSTPTTFAPSPVAIAVYGQNGNFTTLQSGITQSTFSNYLRVKADSIGGLYIVDSSRVLYYAPGNTTAAESILGQPNFTTDIPNYYATNALNVENTRTLGPRDLCGPGTMALDPIRGGFYVADTYNFRVLYFPNMFSPATEVWGQNNSFSTKGRPSVNRRKGRAPQEHNISTVTADTLTTPFAVAVDSNGGIYIADNPDRPHHKTRILYYEPRSTTAVRVYGQNGNLDATYYWDSDEIPASDDDQSNDIKYNPSTFLMNIQHGIWFSKYVYDLAVDKFGGLYVADNDYNRVLYFEPGNSSAPSRVYGQGNNFSTFLPNMGYANPSADTLYNPNNVQVDEYNNVYIADTGNNRVLVYEGESTTATRVYGQSSFNTADSGTSASMFSLATSISIAKGLLYVADDSRVLSFALPPKSTTLTTTRTTTPTTTQTSVMLDSASSTPLSTGAIVGISVGGAVGVTAIAAFVYFKFGSSATGYFTYT